MDLRQAIEVVWDDVADNVYQLPTIHEAVRYARDELTVDELTGALVDSTVVGVSWQTQHDAYIVLRDASPDDVARAVAELV